MTTIKIIASQKQSDESFQINKGATYSFYSSGIWWDTIIPSGPNGFFIKSIFGTRPRYKEQCYFKLCGIIDNDESSIFPIGSKLEKWTAPSSGKLCFFPNDHLEYYHNNRGSIQLTIKELPIPPKT